MQSMSVPDNKKFADGSLRYSVERPPFKLTVEKVNPSAEAPSREDPNSPVYDIYAISRQAENPEDRVDEINLFETGLIINPEDGCMCFVIEEDSLQQFGYRLATSPMYIPPGNKSALCIPLFKFRDTEDDLPHGAQQGNMDAYRQSTGKHRTGMKRPAAAPRSGGMW